jgi:hypothetical protein
MRPMWRDHVVPRLRARGVGADRAAETLRTTGVGESQLVDLIGEGVLRQANPIVATYARLDAVDVRISATAFGGRSADELVRETVAALMPALGAYVFAHGEETWAQAVENRLGDRMLAIAELGTGGSVTTLLGDLPQLSFSELVGPHSGMVPEGHGIRDLAERVRTVGHADIGLAVKARERASDTAVTVAVALPSGTSEVTRTAFQAGEFGRRRAALVAAAELWARLAPSTDPLDR